MEDEGLFRKTIEETVGNALEAKELWLKAALEDCPEKIKEPMTSEYSGTFRLRIPKSLHKRLSGTSRSRFLRYSLSARNGTGVYAIMYVRDADEYERLKSLHTLLSDLDRAKRHADQEGWISEEEMYEVMEV